MKSNIFAIVIIIFGSFSSICAENFRVDTKRLHGKLSDGRYYDPDGIYSTELRITPGTTVDDFVRHDGDNYRFVMTRDHYGNQTGVELVDYPQEFRPILEKNNEAAFELLESFFQSGVMDFLKVIYPSVTIKHEENLILEHIGPARFILLSIEKGSYLSNAGTGTRCDCNRGYLLSFSGKFVIITHVQDSLTYIISTVCGKHDKQGSVEEAFQYVRSTNKILNELIELRLTLKNHQSTAAE